MARAHHRLSAREEIANAYERYVKRVAAVGGRPKNTLFCRGYNEGGQGVPSWVREFYPELMPDTLYRVRRRRPSPAEAREAAIREIVTAYRTYVEHVRQTYGQPSKEIFVERYNTRKENIPAWARRVYQTLNVETIGMWISQLAKEGEGGMLLAYGNRRGTGFFDRNPELRALVERLVAADARAQAAVVLDTIQETFPAASRPSKRTLQRLMQRIKARA